MNKERFSFLLIFLGLSASFFFPSSLILHPSSFLFQSPIDTPTETATEMPTPTATDTPTATNTPTATGTPTKTPTATRKPTKTPTPTATPDPTNKICNPNFTIHTPNAVGGQDFQCWSQDIGLFMHSDKVNPCQWSSVKMGSDFHANGPPTGWEPGDQDTIWQDVDASEPHLFVTLRTVEIHHLYEGSVELRLYGWNGLAWDEVFARLVPDFPINTPANRDVWYPREYKIASIHSAYRLEVYAEMEDYEDGWKAGCMYVGTSLD